MTRSVYVTGLEPQSGKSVVALGLVELLAARSAEVGFFRPIVPSEPDPDPQIALIRDRYRIAADHREMRAMTDVEARSLIAEGSAAEVEKRSVEAYRRLADRYEMVVCEGSDLTDAQPGLDVDLNARLANALGAPVLAVVRSRSAGDAESAVSVTRETLSQKGCELLGVIVTRVPPEEVAATAGAVMRADDGRPVYIVAEQPELAAPTVGEVAAALGAEPISDPDGWATREVRDVQVAAMGVEQFIADLAEGTLVIVPGDRADILVASLASTLAPGVPAVAGIVLSGDYQPRPAVQELLRGAPFPVLHAAARTDAVATGAREVRPSIEPGSERKIASALGAFQSAVDSLELEQRLAVERPVRMTPAMFEHELIERAKESPQRIVLPEGGDERILAAADILLRRGAAELVILGDPEEVRGRASALGLDLSGGELVDPLASPLREGFAERYHELRKHKGVTEELALETIGDEIYFGTLMVLTGEAGGMVSGAAHTTAETIRPAFELIKAREGVSVVSSIFLMCMADGVLAYGDCAVNPTPDVEQLADIAISSADTAFSFGVEPRVAMLSYSTGESGKGEEVDAVRSATELVRERRPDLPVAGPIQYDAAIDPGVAEMKLPGSEVAGTATVFVFPDLETGNIAYKAVQRSSGAVAIGPVLQGLRKPVNDLSRGCGVEDVVSTVVITAIQAQEASGRSTSRLRVRLPAVG